METWTHKVVRTMPYKGNEYAGCAIRVTAGLSKLQGNTRPYFSVTGKIYGNGPCGCIHDEILRHWPELAPVVALHLSDDNGQPMHGEANGWYWLAGYYGGAGERYHGASGSSAKTPEECLQVFADHVRLSFGGAQILANLWQHGVEYAEAKEPFQRWYAQQAERFKAEADAAVILLDSMGTEA